MQPTRLLRQPKLSVRIQRWGERFFSRRRNLALLGGLLFLYVYVAGDYGLYQLYGRWRAVERLEVEIRTLEEERAVLQERQVLLEAGDLEVIERIARERYGMVRPGESIYRVQQTAGPDDAR